jgi:hypothetical protein
MILFLVSLSAFAQSKAKPPCTGPVHAYACDAPMVTVSQLTAEEKRQIQDSETAIQTAQAMAETVRNRIIEAHGGFVAEECGGGSGMFGGACLIESGSRLSDDAEWKGDWLILSKKWIPEL